MKTEIAIIGIVIIILVGFFFYHSSLNERKADVNTSLEELGKKNAELAKFFENKTSER